MLDRLQSYIKAEELFQRNQPVLLAVSAGMDSVCLAHLFLKAGVEFGIAHCNFKLRGEDSEADERFVKELAKEMRVKFFNASFETTEFAEKMGISIQMAARDLRYEWLEKIRKENEYSFIATAHHLNDSIETLLLNLNKGTGIRGLHGILPKVGSIVRPLLFATREQILTYIKTKKLRYREDASNADNKYQRNLIRHKVIPVLREINPELESTFASSLKHFKDTEAIYLHAMERYRKDLLKQQGHEYWLPFRKLLKYPAPDTICYELLKEFGFNSTQVQQLLRSGTQSGKLISSSTHRVVRDRNHWIITPKDEQLSMHHFITEETQEMQLEDVKLKIKTSKIDEFNLSKDPKVGALDFDKLEWPLQLRHWSEGDYFYPFGLKKPSQKPAKKKLSDYFVDQKMSLPEKDKTWILCSGQRVAWVVGHRIDERFKISDKTKKVCILEKIPS